MGKRKTLYAPMQVRKGHKEQFQNLCKNQGLHEVDGFGQAVFAWQNKLVQNEEIQQHDEQLNRNT